MPNRQKPDGMAVGGSEGLASGFYQLKTGCYLTGQYLHWTKNQPTAQSWWCQY